MSLLQDSRVTALLFESVMHVNGLTFQKIMISVKDPSQSFYLAIRDVVDHPLGIKGVTRNEFA